MARGPLVVLFVDVGGTAAGVVVPPEQVEDAAHLRGVGLVAAELPEEVAGLGAALLRGDEREEPVADRHLGVVGRVPGHELVGALSVQVRQREAEFGGHGGAVRGGVAQPLRVRPDADGADDDGEAQGDDGDECGGRLDDQPRRRRQATASRPDGRRRRPGSRRCGRTRRAGRRRDHRGRHLRDRHIGTLKAPGEGKAVVRRTPGDHGVTERNGLTGSVRPAPVARKASMVTAYGPMSRPCSATQASE